MSHRRWILPFAAALACPAAALGAPSTTLVTGDAGGAALSSSATDITMTPDARYVAFVTAVPLDATDTNGTNDVYRRDRRAGLVERVSVPRSGLGGVDGSSSHPSISADGTKVAFESRSEVLTPGDMNGGADVFVRDLAAQTTTRVSVRLDGTLAGPASTTSDDVMLPAISADGRVVAFLAPDFAITPNPSNAFHVFVRRLDRPGAERVDTTAAGAAPNGEPRTGDAPSLSADGRLVAFSSAASNLVPGDINAHFDVFVRDRATATTRRASVSSNGGEGSGGDAERPALSADGSAVAFESFAPNLVANDNNNATDVFVRDLAAGQTSRASVTPSGGESTYGGTIPAISGDGRYVAFSTITSLISGDAGNADVYLEDRQTGFLQRSSLTATGGNALGDAGAPLAVGATGRHVLFETLQPFVASDGNGANDGYLRDTGIDTSPVARPRVTGGAGSLEIAVDGGDSTDPDGWVESYSWSFGDGASAAGPRGPHRYAAPGRYSVVLTVTDNDGSTATATTTVDVTAPPADAAPPAGPEAPPLLDEPLAKAPSRAPRNQRRPSVTRKRGVLRCSPGRWEGTPRFSYAWRRDGILVTGATTRSYRVRRTDAGRRLTCRVTAKLPGRPAGVAVSASVRIPRSHR